MIECASASCYAEALTLERGFISMTLPVRSPHRVL